MLVHSFLIEKGYNVAYVGIYGSQNYWLDIYTEEYESDYDFKAVIVPSLKDLVNNSKPISTTIEYEWGQIDLKDIRVFTETLCKCNPAYIETLYTPYSIYTDDYKKIIDERKNLVSEMGVFLLKASYGMIKEKEKAFSHPYPSIKDKIDKWGYDPKQLHHIVRLNHLMSYFIESEQYIIDIPNVYRLNLLDIKTGKINLEEAIPMRDNFVWQSKKIIDEYKVEPTFEAKERIIQYSKDLIYNKIKMEEEEYLSECCGAELDNDRCRDCKEMCG